ncbi:MAG: DUF4174 domain-containing protein [Vannielia sp.]|uniref:DUF4174 domain-containing protein n=1 Tax=Rhodobacterales TaxID=204455 RepID=UPI0020962041|nr:DUF4174 domain-containing protein [Oceanicola sp. 502str15]MCO6381248.1 DUF4174 domain-containing protein [Oceanicola sp. 502str15]
MRLTPIALALTLAAPAFAQETGPAVISEGAAEEAVEALAAEVAGDADTLQILAASEVTLADFLWLRRPVVIFADTPADPRFIEQLELLTARPGPMMERDAVVITDTDPSTLSPVRKQLRPRGFQLVLIGKDGEVKLRKPFPWDVREITRSIDKWPLRRDELRQK